MVELERRHEWEALKRARDQEKIRTDELEAVKAVERMQQRRARTLKHLALEKAREEETAKEQRALLQKNERDEATSAAKEANKEKMEMEKEKERRAEVRSRVQKDVAKVQLHELAAAKALAARQRMWEEAERRREEQREASVAKRHRAFRAVVSRRSTFAAVERKLLRDKEQQLADLEKVAALATAAPGGAGHGGGSGVWTGGSGDGLSEARLEALDAALAGPDAAGRDGAGGAQAAAGGAVRQRLLEEDSAAAIRAKYRAARRQVVSAKSAERRARLRLEHMRSAQLLGKAAGSAGTWEVAAARTALVAAEDAVAREAAAEHALQHRLYESEGA